MYQQDVSRAHAEIPEEALAVMRDGSVDCKGSCNQMSVVMFTICHENVRCALPAWFTWDEIAVCAGHRVACLLVSSGKVMHMQPDCLVRHALCICALQSPLKLYCIMCAEKKDIKYPSVGEELTGKVASTANYGVFVAINDDLRALLHQDEIATPDGREVNVKGMFNVGDDIKVSAVLSNSIACNIRLCRALMHLFPIRHACASKVLIAYSRSQILSPHCGVLNACYNHRSLNHGSTMCHND